MLFKHAAAGLAASVAVLAASTHAHAQTTTIALEGGLACSRGDVFARTTNLATGAVHQVGDEGCGSRGGLEISRTGAPVFSIFDHWAVRGRVLSVDDKEAISGTADTWRFKERRVTLDAEVGTKLSGFSFFGGTTRVTVGLRYADWSMDFNGVTSRDDVTVRGIGPRVGLRSVIPLFGSIVYESNTGVSALFARHEVTFARPGLVGQDKDTNTVFGIDSTSALTYRLDGTETGRAISIGMFSEYAFGQLKIDATKNDRHHWGPFARVRFPLP